MAQKTISLADAATRRGSRVITVPSLDELGDGSPTKRLMLWLTREHGLQHLDNVFCGDKLFERLNAAEKKFQGNAKSAALVDAQIGPLDSSEGFRLIGDGLFIVRPAS